MKKQNGMTLVEVIATLLISSLIIVLIWTTVAISMKYNIAETNKLRMQQDANYIITDIQEIHRKYDCYQIMIDDQGTWESTKCSTGEKLSVYSNPKFKYVLDGPSDQIYTTRMKGYEEKYKASYVLTVKIYKLNNYSEKPDLEVETVISRYEEDTR